MLRRPTRGQAPGPLCAVGQAICPSWAAVDLVILGLDVTLPDAHVAGIRHRALVQFRSSPGPAARDHCRMPTCRALPAYARSSRPAPGAATGRYPPCVPASARLMDVCQGLGTRSSHPRRESAPRDRVVVIEGPRGCGMAQTGWARPHGERFVSTGSGGTQGRLESESGGSTRALGWLQSFETADGDWPCWRIQVTGGADRPLESSQRSHDLRTPRVAPADRPRGSISTGATRDAGRLGWTPVASVAPTARAVRSR